MQRQTYGMYEICPSEASAINDALNGKDDPHVRPAMCVQNIMIFFEDGTEPFPLTDLGTQNLLGDFPRQEREIRDCTFYSSLREHGILQFAAIQYRSLNATSFVRSYALLRKQRILAADVTLLSVREDKKPSYGLIIHYRRRPFVTGVS